MHRVMWAVVARVELAAIWNSSSPSEDQLLIWAVADLVFRLERYPETDGESRPMDTRVTFSRPLAVWYHILVDGTVWIRHIWRY
jgi:hypothetical protein